MVQGEKTTGWAGVKKEISNMITRENRKVNDKVSDLTN